jgi:hypothetical protein
VEKGVDWALRWLFSYDLPNQFISWKYVQLLSGSDLLQLSVSQKKLLTSILLISPISAPWSNHPTWKEE